MTEPPQDDDGRPEPGGHQPYVPPSSPHGQPQYGPPPGGPPPYGAPQRYGPPQYGQPQYGQPQYGPPSGGPPQYGPPPGGPPDLDRPHGRSPAAPGPYVAGPFGTPPGPAPVPRRSHVGAIAGGTLLLVLLIAGAVTAALTLGPRILSREATERDVAAQFEEVNGVAIDLECPDDMVLASGAEYTCVGTTEDGQEVQLAITVTDPPGDAEYTWAEI